jgi:hypothetical protein
MKVVGVFVRFRAPLRRVRIYVTIASCSAELLRRPRGTPWAAGSSSSSFCDLRLSVAQHDGIDQLKNKKNKSIIDQ